MGLLETEYMGLKLDNPFILGSSTLSASLENLKKAESAGFGAVVLRSVFEELILEKTENVMRGAEDYLSMAGAYDFLKNAAENKYINDYCNFIVQAKKTVSIPVIASINCAESTAWINYAKYMEQAGADAIELNFYAIASDSSVTSAEIEKHYVSVAKEIKKAVHIPVAMKIGWHFSSLANIICKFDKEKIDGIVMFNHFYRPDIDIDKIEISSSYIQPKGDFGETLRWTAMMSEEIDADICSSTGIRDTETAIKMLLAGASCVQLTSAIYQNGFEYVSKMKVELVDWMKKHGFSSVNQFKGKLAQNKTSDSQEWERTQYIKSFRI